MTRTFQDYLDAAWSASLEPLEASWPDRAWLLCGGEPRKRREAREVNMSYPRDMDDVAHEVLREQVRCFGDRPDTVLLQTLVLCEEAGEVARVAAKSAQGIRADTRGKWAEELGDVLVVALGLCARLGINADRAVNMRLQKLRDRKAGA